MDADRNNLERPDGGDAETQARLLAVLGEQNARQIAERAKDRIARLQRVTEGLNRAVDTKQLAELILQLGARACEAGAGILVEVLPDGQSIRTIAALGYPSAAVRMEPVPLSSPTPMSDCILTGEAIMLGSHQEFASRYPAIAELRRGFGHEAAAAIPLIVGDRVLGGLAFSFVEQRSFDQEEKDFLLDVGLQCALGLERARVYEAMRASEERFEKFMHYLPGLAWIKDFEGRYVYANAAARKVFMTAQPHQELYGKVDGDLFPPETARQFTENDRRALMTVAGIQVVETLEHDGIFHHSLVSKFPIPGPDGSPLYIGGTAFDITEMMEAKEALAERERELKALNDSLEQKVREQTASIRWLASDLTRAEQRERKRLSHILHDDLQQQLYAIQMQFELFYGNLIVGDAELEKSFTEIKTQLSETIRLTRRLSVGLNPPVLHDEGLTQAIGWLGAQMREQHGLEIALEAEETFAIPDPDLQVLLFSSVRELLFNVVKHAGVDRALVKLQPGDDGLLIEVRDEGRGFDPAAVSKKTEAEIGLEGLGEFSSFGLPTLQHRLSLFGGRMEVESRPGAGTQIRMVVPARAGDVVNGVS